jgi:hypothetical protein
VDATGLGRQAWPRSGYSFRKEVLVRNKLLLTVAAMVAAIGTVTGVAASSPTMTAAFHL